MQPFLDCDGLPPHIAFTAEGLMSKMKADHSMECPTGLMLMFDQRYDDNKLNVDLTKTDVSFVKQLKRSVRLVSAANRLSRNRRSKRSDQ